jgi:hypothetical protein
MNWTEPGPQQDNHADQGAEDGIATDVGLEDVGYFVFRAGACGLLPAFGFGDIENNQKRQQGGRGGDEEQHSPTGLVKSQAHHGDQQKTDVRCGADQAGQHRPPFDGPDLHDQGDAEGPLAAHAQRGHERRTPVAMRRWQARSPVKTA